MVARIYAFPPAKGYSMRGDCDMDGKPLWWVELTDGEGVVHDQWVFATRVAALAFLRSKPGQRW